jgi:hypothetical protein
MLGFRSLTATTDWFPRFQCNHGSGFRGSNVEIALMRQKKRLQRFHCDHGNCCKIAEAFTKSFFFGYLSL